MSDRNNDDGILAFKFSITESKTYSRMEIDLFTKSDPSFKLHGKKKVELKNLLTYSHIRNMPSQNSHSK